MEKKFESTKLRYENIKDRKALKRRSGTYKKENKSETQPRKQNEKKSTFNKTRRDAIFRYPQAS